MKGKQKETMTMQAQPSSNSEPIQGDEIQLEISSFSNNSTEGCMQNENSGQSDAEQLLENQYRAGAYSMLAALLRQPPQQEILNTVTGLADVVEEKDSFAIAMSMLGLAARTATPVELDDEYHSLFIGLGRGELVPYGSWY